LIIPTADRLQISSNRLGDNRTETYGFDAPSRFKTVTFCSNAPTGPCLEKTYKDRRLSPPPAVFIKHEEMSDCIREYITNLPPDYRTVIVMSELEGMSNQKVAGVLEISLDNVKVRLHRARAKLREAFDSGCDFYHNEQNILACDRKKTQILPKTPQ
jgi:RNA polymerase sigma factor (sigma-70 family)